VTFDEIVAAANARVGHRVRVTHKENGRTVRTHEGVLEAAGDAGVQSIPGNEAGHVAVTYRIAPLASWVRLDSTAAIDAIEQRDGRLLRVEMHEENAFVIETLG
jgi:hypothetical protein